MSDIQQTPYLQHTTDGGNTWETQLSPFGDQNGSNAIFSIFFIDSQTGWITGDLGRIARYYGTTDVEEEINSLNKFSLHQNYPNPFNPSTTIRYQVPDFSFVSLIVYDLLGNKIKTLVNEEKPAGKYEIEFNSVDLPGGVYFYQLNAGSYAETKKMLLLK
ncbi:MAG: T9SS type A sorting domain-containing protein [Ignavibacteriaceae bacterium]|nr:T9SS type A sorting domain-containing protein [Ignavibacteriaceae bacterium]